MTLEATRLPVSLGEAVYTYPDKVHSLTEQLGQAETTITHLQESLSELILDDRGWMAYTLGVEQELTGTARKQIVDICRTLSIAHPLLKRGLTVRAGYIWGQGVEVTARVPSADGSADVDLQDEVNQVIDAFEKLNEASFTGMRAREELERAEGTDGEVFLALFTNPADGVVKVRSIPQLQIRMIVCNPEDDDEPWFYLREYTVADVPKANQPLESPPTRTVRVIYPALGFDPRQAGLGFKPTVLNGARVMWDAPMIHVPVNRLDGWKRGIPDVYASVAWARMYGEFLVDWAKLTKSLSKIAWKATGETKSRAQLAATAIKARQQSADPTLPPPNQPAGATVVTGPGSGFEAVSKSGATIDSESGKPLAGMVAAGLGVPVTVLLADPGITGARAVAETLDTPTILEMGMRRLMWQSVIQQVLFHAIATAGMVPGSALRSLTGDRQPVLEFNWPPLAGLDPIQLVTAIATADTTGKMPPLTTLRLLLGALGVPNVDEVLAEVTDEEGNFIDPRASAGDTAVKAFRRGEDPAATMRGNDPQAGVAAEVAELMEAGGHVYHWKHGWIPLDHTAAGDVSTAHVAQGVVDHATKVEPKLTSAVSDLADTHGGTMEGLDFKVKGVGSLARKIQADVDDPQTDANTPAHAASKLFDVNRYTMTLPDDRYAKGAQSTLDALRAKGYKVKVKNYWNVPGNPYQGINVQVTSPDGDMFELQFHTPKSLSIKEGALHTLYEKQRVTKDDATRGELDQQMHKVAATIPVPPRVETVS